MDDVLTLITTLPATRDENGVMRTKDERREVFCDRQSITRSEFFDAGRAGLNPEFMARVACVDYNGETVVQYRGKGYAVYRSYLPEGSDYIELYLRREGGTNGY